MRVDSTYRSASDDHVVAVSGDIDVHDIDALCRNIRATFTGRQRTVVRLDGVGSFGIAAARALTDLLDEATAIGADVVVDGLPRIARRVLDILGVDDERILSNAPLSGPVPHAVLDAVISGSAVRAREPICVTTHDVQDPRIVYVNDAFTSITGYRSDDVLGRNPKLLQGPLTDRETIDHLKACLVNDDEFDGVAVNYRADGGPFWMNWRIVTISYGAHRYFLALQRDVTELHQLARLNSARTRMTRVINNAAVPISRSKILAALGIAVAAVIESADAVVAVAVTDADNEVIAANLEGQYSDPSSFTSSRRQVHEVDGSVVVHHPFAISDELTGHVLVSELHVDWLKLLDVDHLEQLFDDCITPLRNAVD